MEESKIEDDDITAGRLVVGFLLAYLVAIVATYVTTFTEGAMQQQKQIEAFKQKCQAEKPDHETFDCLRWKRHK